MKKWNPFASTVQSPNSTVSVAQTPETVPVITAADAKQFGLENFGNTCYANSVLQALYFCGPFRDLVVQYPDASSPDLPIANFLPSSPPPQSPPLSPQQRPKPGRSHSISGNAPALASCSNPTSAAAPNVPLSIPMPNAPPTLLSALRSLYLYISKNPAEKGTVAPRAFIDKLKELNELFRSTMHQDAHEFLNYLLNQIVEEMDEDRKKSQNGNGNGSAGTTHSREDLSASIGSLSLTAGHPASVTLSNPMSSNTTLVHRLFEGTLTSETRCLTCETVSSRDESFLDLSIDIEQHSSVTACLRQFSASEMLCQRNKFFCDSCCDLQEAEKRMKIKKLPNILALHLKRFKYQEDVGKYIKLAYRVAFPLELRLFNTVDGTSNPDRLYELFAIVVHIGNGPHHGHYVSIIKARGTWYLFDDDNVEAIKETDIPKYFGDSNAGSAYVLYYQASDLDISALGLRAPEPATATDTSTSDVSVSNSRSTLTPTAENMEDDAAAGTSPSLPPGLPIETGQNARVTSSMGAPPAIVTSPNFSAPASPGSQPQSPSSPTQPQSNLALHIPLPPVPSGEATPLPSAAPPTPTASSSSNRKFFNSLRHAPSLRIRPSTSNGTPDRTSILDIPAVPPLPIAMSASMTMPRSASLDQGNGNNGLSTSPTAAPAASPSTSPMSVPMSTSPSLSTIASNGKEKEKEKEKSTPAMWLKRKSFRQDKPPPSSSPGSVGERSISANGPPSDEHSTPWYKSAKRVQRRASEAGLMSPAASPSYQQASPLTHTSVPMSLVPVPEHKRSTTAFSPSEGSARHPSRRPSTAGGNIERPSSTYIPPVPSIPPMASPRSPHTEPKSTIEGRHSPLANGVASPNGAAPPSEPARHQRYSRPHTSHSHPPSPPSAGLGFSSSNGTSSTLNTTAGESTSTGSSSTSGGKTKRATRKLSFSAPMLGFGRKDKDKQRPQSPAYSQTSSAGNR